MNSAAWARVVRVYKSASSSSHFVISDVSDVRLFEKRAQQTSHVCMFFIYFKWRIAHVAGEPWTHLTSAHSSGDVGVVWVRGPQVTKGYYRNPEANAAAFDREGFFNTGVLCFSECLCFLCDINVCGLHRSDYYRHF